MVWERLGLWSGKAEIEKHEDLFVGRKSEGFVEVVDVDAVEPAAVDAGIGGSEHHVGGNDGGVLDAGLSVVGLRACGGGIGVNVGLVVGDDEYGRGSVAARGVLVNLGESLGRLDDIDMLFLEVLGCRSDTARFEDGVKLLLRDLLGAVVLLAGIAGLDNFCKFHDCEF